MADVRALLAAERQSRRISHPHLSYTKTGMLICTVCNLNVKSEALWDGHLRSANHRKNALASQEPTNKPLKRKIEDVDVPQEDRYEAFTDGRKKPKSRPESLLDGADDKINATEEDVTEEGPAIQRDLTLQSPSPTNVPLAPSPNPSSNLAQPNDTKQQPEVDEDEWAAFEREVVPLTAEPMTQPTYEGATITAAPVSAAQLAEQTAEEKRRRIETEAQDEKEDEERRLEEEFDIMEEMEERVRKLREKRDALRQAAPAKDDTGQDISALVEMSAEKETGRQLTVTLDENDTHANYDEDDDDDDDEDDWYR